MPHYARVINGLVVDVNVATEEWIKQQPDHYNWIQTSYNTYAGIHYNMETGQPDGGIPLRKNFAGIGFNYDKKRDAFIPAKPFTSWVLNEDTCLWEAPIPKPDDNKDYLWNEAEQEWTYTKWYTNEKGELVREE